MNPILKPYLREEEESVKRGPGCNTVSTLLTLAFLSSSPLTGSILTGESKPLFPLEGVVVFVACLLALFAVYVGLSHLQEGYELQLSMRQLLRRRTFSGILAVLFSGWLLIGAYWRIFPPKPGLTFDGRAISSEEARLFRADLRSLNRAFSAGIEEGALDINYPFVSTSPGAEFSQLLRNYYPKMALATRKLLILGVDQEPIHGSMLATDRGVENAKLWLSDLKHAIKIELTRRRSFNFARIRYLLRLSLEPEYLPKAPVPPSNHPMLASYEKLILFCKSKPRRYTNGKLIFASADHRQQFSKLYRDTVDTSARYWQRRDEDELFANPHPYPYDLLSEDQ